MMKTGQLLFAVIVSISIDTVARVTMDCVLCTSPQLIPGAPAHAVYQEAARGCVHHGWTSNLRHVPIRLHATVVGARAERSGGHTHHHALSRGFELTDTTPLTN